jgi:hypothetical protein
MNDFQDSESFGPRNRIREIRTFGSVGGWFKRLAGLPDRETFVGAMDSLLHHYLPAEPLGISISGIRLPWYFSKVENV